MRKWMLLLLLSLWLLNGCAQGKEAQVVKTYPQTALEEAQGAAARDEMLILQTHYEMDDGTWKTQEHTYAYRLVITGRLHNAVEDTTYIVLSNNQDITFDQTWKASGLSSNLEDYFRPEDAVIVGIG